MFGLLLAGRVVVFEPPGIVKTHPVKRTRAISPTNFGFGIIHCAYVIFFYAYRVIIFFIFFRKRHSLIWPAEMTVTPATIDSVDPMVANTHPLSMTPSNEPIIPISGAIRAPIISPSLAGLVKSCINDILKSAFLVAVGILPSLASMVAFFLYIKMDWMAVVSESATADKPNTIPARISLFS